jgi:enolase-phosphatase E1
MNVTASNSRTFRNVKCVLLDIEGTVSDIRFVYDIMFPYARSRASEFLQTQISDSAVQNAFSQMASDRGESLTEWLGAPVPSVEHVPMIVAAVHALMDTDSKSTGLKALQGLIWKSGFETGALRAELFPDVVPQLSAWHSSGIRLAIYSSGSVLAQKLFFRYTTQGNVATMLDGFFDTTIGKKQEAASYERIAHELGLKPNEVVFLSDVAAELDACRAVGMPGVATVRPNNKPLPEDYRGAMITSLDQLDLSL